MFTEWKSQELNLEIVCQAAALSGKTPNLRYVYTSIDPWLWVEPVFLQTREDKILFFLSAHAKARLVTGLDPMLSVFRGAWIGRPCYGIPAGVRRRQHRGFVGNSQADRFWGSEQASSDGWPSAARAFPTAVSCQGLPTGLAGSPRPDALGMSS